MKIKGNIENKRYSHKKQKYTNVKNIKKHELTKEFQKNKKPQKKGRIQKSHKILVN